MSEREESAERQENGSNRSNESNRSASRHGSGHGSELVRVGNSMTARRQTKGSESELHYLHTLLLTSRSRSHRKSLVSKSRSRSSRSGRIVDYDSQPTHTGGGDVSEYSGTYRPYECSICGKTYSKAQYVSDHFRTIHLGSELNYSCRVCGQTSAWRVTVLKHIKRSHPEKNTTEMIDRLF